MASMCFSSTTTVRPMALKISRASATSSGVAWALAAMRRHALANQAGGVGHGANHARRAPQLALDERRGDRRRDGDDHRVPAQHLLHLAENPLHLLGFQNN